MVNVPTGGRERKIFHFICTLIIYQYKHDFPQVLGDLILISLCIILSCGSTLLTTYKEIKKLITKTKIVCRNY